MRVSESAAQNSFRFSIGVFRVSPLVLLREKISDVSLLNGDSHMQDIESRDRDQQFSGKNLPVRNAGYPTNRSEHSWMKLYQAPQHQKALINYHTEYEKKRSCTPRQESIFSYPVHGGNWVVPNLTRSNIYHDI
jgi:hypothetical protein